MRRPVSLLAGLMWVDPGRGPAAAQHLRHEAQERDGAQLLPPLPPSPTSLYQPVHLRLWLRLQHDMLVQSRRKEADIQRKSEGPSKPNGRGVR